MASHDYSRSVTGVLTDESNGETYEHAFSYAGRDCWADSKAVETGWAWTIPTGKPALMLRLAVKAGVVTGARKWKEGEEIAERGKAVSPDPEQIGATAEFAEDVKPAATIEWEGKLWNVDELAVTSRAARFEDGRTVALHVAPSGHVRALVVLQDEPQETPRGVAWPCKGERMLYTHSAALALSSGAQGAALAAMPVRPERDLRSLFTKEADALDTTKQDAPVVNLPIRFWAISAESEAGDKIRPPIRGIILFRFEVAEDFGTNDRKRSDDEDARAAYIFLTTVDGVLVSDRDNEKPYLVPAGTLVWVDEKSDLRTLRRFVPRWEGERMDRITRCSEVLATPKKLASFQLPNGDPGKAWRIELKFLRHVVHPATLKGIAALVDQLPDLPIRQARTIEAQAESWG